MNMPNNIESIESKFNLNLVDVESLVDILAEQEALVEFDKEMEEKK
jgi:hypothetical protein